jgi:hypothetical protein
MGTDLAPETSEKPSHPNSAVCPIKFHCYTRALKRFSSNLLGIKYRARNQCCTSYVSRYFPEIRRLNMI